MAAPQRAFNSNVVDAGVFDQRITLEAPNATEDELGQKDIVWESDGVVWAQVIETQGREFLKGGYSSEELAVFVIRWREIDSRSRVRWNGRIWDIVSVTGTRRDGFRWLHTQSLAGGS